MVKRYLRNEKLTPVLVWEHTEPKIKQSSNGFIVFDDSILDRGIGFVNCIYINPESNEYWLIDYRIFDPELDGKSKVDHLQDMLKNALLVDTWYASNEFMLFVNNLGSPIKCNRLSI